MGALLEGSASLTLSDPKEVLELTCPSRTSASQVLHVDKDVKSLTIHLDAQAGSYVKLLILRLEGEEDAQLEGVIRVSKDAYVEMGILDLADGGLHTNIHADLNEEGAQANLHMGQLVKEAGARTSDLHIDHKRGHTIGNMHNFAVLYDNANYEMVATGKIENGCKEAQSHQETRVLTLGDGHKTKILPILLIDENDVKASHAMTVGQPDASQLYYLQSRGLSKEQAMGLLAIGYFMPVIELADDESLKDSLRQTLERKAGLYGHQHTH
jgi:Fe-S cluster assembly protein SufD